MHAYTHTYIHTYMHTCMHTYFEVHIYIHACTHTHIHTYIHTYIHTEIQKYIQKYKKRLNDAQRSQVTLVGNAPWLKRLSRQLTSARRKQLSRVRSFLKLQTTRNYTCPRTGRAKCALPSVSILDRIFVNGISMPHCIDIKSDWFATLEAGGKDLKATQVYPGTLGLLV